MRELSEKNRQIYADQDTCLMAIADGNPVPARFLAALPPWRAVLIGSVAQRAGIPLEGGTLEDLRLEANRVGGEGQLVWPLRTVRTKPRSQDLQGT